jgi:hypothetical protein
MRKRIKYHSLASFARWAALLCGNCDVALDEMVDIELCVGCPVGVDVTE